MNSTNYSTTQEKWVVSPTPSSRKIWVAMSVILMFHINGFIGIGFSSYTKFFVGYTPLNLLVAAAMIIWVQAGKNRSFWYFLVGSGVAGWLIEFVGVRTGLPFGQYHYHDALGFELVDIPLMTAVIWWLTAFGASAIANEFATSRYSRMVLAALLMVLFDVPVEHITGKMGMWHWEIGYAPFQNYLGWLFYGAIMQYFLQTMNIERKNTVAIVYFISAFLFFLGLDMIEW